ncbi:MAG: 50S ribosomal protein L15 [Deltaproteobacteria bacterium RIFOXYD12_FULL_50_9]|nr:MAG: 50S ribosomal protein L15 [Deltaproteobacteria bacterium RIFOXYD12_FULL_50_9]
MNLSNLSPSPGSRKQRKRIGRGSGSGHGKTATRGHKGQKARSGSGIKLGFEGGQMPLQRRLPKRGFTSPFKLQYGVINVKELDRFPEGTRVDRQLLVDAGLVATKYKLVKILGEGEVSRSLTIAVDKISQSAVIKIKAAGGTVEE